MKIDDFKDLMSSNADVNNTMGSFNEKLLGIQKEIQSLDAMKNMFAWKLIYRTGSRPAIRKD